MAEEEAAASLAQYKDISIFSEDGKEVPLGSVFENSRAIIEYVEDLAKIPAGHFRDVRMVVIGCAGHTDIKGFRKETKYTQELYCDPDRRLYKAFELKASMGGTGGHSEHVKSSIVGGTLKSIWRGLKSMHAQGNVLQQGGAFVVAPGGTILYEHRDDNPQDHAPINDLLVAAGLPRFDFAAKPAAASADAAGDGAGVGAGAAS